MTSARAVDAVLFDLYDTLVRPDSAALDAGRLALAQRAGVDVGRLRLEWQRTFPARSLGTLGSMEEQLAHMLAACDLAPGAAAIRELAELEYATWRDSVRPFPDTWPVLERLRGAGYRLGILSNCSCQAGAVIDSLGLRSLVDVAILSFEVGVMKPDAAMFRLAAARLGVAPGRALLVDDLVENLDAASAVGLRTALIERYEGAGEQPSDHPRLASLDQLVRVLDAP
jgi:putative hydrolase of the HAD superfamily